MSLLTAAARRRATYTPLALPWVDLFWTEGPEFAALGLANGAVLTSWPSETSAVDVPTTLGAPMYQAAGVNGRPSVQAFGTESMRIATGGALTPQPWSAIAIARSSVGGGTIGFSMTSSSALRGLTSSAFGAGTLNLVFPVTTGLHVWEGVANGVSSALYQDGALVSSGDAGSSAQTAQRILLARSPAGLNALDGHLVLAGLLPRAMTAPERAALKAWATARYGTP